MTTIQVLGPGCKRCQALYEHARSAAEQLGLEFEIEKVTDLEALIAYGVMATPALLVNGQLKVTGRVPSAEQLKAVLS